MAAVSGTCFTDPFCPWSWAAEPTLRRLQSEFGAGLSLTFVIAGFAQEIDAERARELALETLEASAAAGQPADARVWLDDPPASTYPAGVAFHAVAAQGDPLLFLRRVREAVFLDGRRMDAPDALIDAAGDAGGLDLERLRADLDSHPVRERFEQDLERGRAGRSTSAASPPARSGR